LSFSSTIHNTPGLCGLIHAQTLTEKRPEEYKEVKVRGGKAPYAGNALKVMPIIPSPATFYDRERP
jgi:hypothetical protein